MTFRLGMIPFALSLALSSGIAGAQDNSATVTQLQGGVLVNRGQDFAPVGLNDVLNASDIILTRADASIGLVFGDGSSIVLPGNIQASAGDVQACLAQVPLNEPITLTNLSGTVFVMPIDGEGDVVPATEGQTVAPGQRVISGEGSSVDISYPGECTVGLGLEEFLDIRFAQECCVPNAALTSSTAALGADAMAALGSGLSVDVIAGLLTGALFTASFLADDGDDSDPDPDPGPDPDPDRPVSPE